MSDKALKLLGLMRKAGAIELGETATGNTVRAGKAKLLLLAADASENAAHRAECFSHGRSVIPVRLPYTKAEISESLGAGGCSMAAVTDLGFANALLKELCQTDPESYSAALEETGRRLEKAGRRKTESLAHERNKRNQKRRTNI